MTNERRQAAGRANGRAGKDRKSAAGKAGSAQNAFRHGLSLPLLADPAASAEVAAFAAAMAPPSGAGEPGEAASELAHLARAIAEAQLDLVRVRRARHDLITAALASPGGVPDGGVPDAGVPDGESSRIDGERARLLARAERLASHQGPWASLLGQIAAQLRSPRSEPDKLARILGDLARELAAIDRYERRARWRRRHAVEAYDDKKMYLSFIQSIRVSSRTKVSSDSRRRTEAIDTALST